MNLDDEVLEAATVVEALAGTDGLLVLPANNRNAVSVQVVLRGLARELAGSGSGGVGAQVVCGASGRPLLYLIDTRGWPEEAERRLLRDLPGVKCGSVPPELRRVVPSVNPTDLGPEK